MQPFKWTVPCAGGVGERGGGGCGWTELLSSNSLNAERGVYPAPRGVREESAIGEKVQIVSPSFLLLLLLPLCPHTQSFPAASSPLTSTCQALDAFSLGLLRSHTRCLFVSPTPLFFFLHSFIYSSLCPGKAQPHAGGRGRGLAQGTRGGNISTFRTNLAEDGGAAL